MMNTVTASDVAVRSRTDSGPLGVAQGHCSRSASAGGCDMNIYRTLGDRIGTSEARELARQLVAWHDATVKHLRVVASGTAAECADDCPHVEAGVLWTAAQDVLGASARQLEFLRSHGQRRRASTLPIARDRAAEMGA
jgi:hypothetical protein